MKKEDIKLSDIKRILLGDAPPEFMLEVFIRTLLIYVFFIVIIRLLGKRMSGQLSITELGVVITLGAIIAPMMQLPDRGLLQGAFMLLCILFFHNRITAWGVKNQKVEEITQGKLSLLVKDGVMQVDEMKSTRIPKQQLFAAIRSKEVYNLGKVERLYLEACGTFSLYTANDSRPGLAVFPPFDESIKKSSLLTHVDHGLKACCNCGNTQVVINDETRCSICNENTWDIAVI
jgi:uncharacterized membrane protein YcaP (DUF421 family)